jgi:hypothetical protein
MAVGNIPAHAWSLEVAHTIIGTSCLIQDVTPESSSHQDMSWFLMTAWAVHPNLIPIEDGGVILEPEEPSVVGEPPLFLWEYEIIYSKNDTLRFRAFIRVLEVHDFSLPEDSADDDGNSSSSSKGGNGLPPSHPSSSWLGPWLWVYRLTRSTDVEGKHIPSLPHHGGGIDWLRPSSRAQATGGCSVGPPLPSGMCSHQLAAATATGHGVSPMANENPTALLARTDTHIGRQGPPATSNRRSTSCMV